MNKPKKELPSKCPKCGESDVIIRDRDNNVFSCINNHYWQSRGGENLTLRKLSPSEASVKLNMLLNQYREELRQLKKMGAFLEVDFSSLDQLRSAQLEMVRDGELIVFLRPDDSVLYVLSSLFPNTP